MSLGGATCYPTRAHRAGKEQRELMSKGPPLFREKSLADGLVFLRHPNTIVGVAGPLLVRPAILNIPSSVACAGYNNVLGQPTFKMQLEHHALGGVIRPFHILIIIGGERKPSLLAKR